MARIFISYSRRDEAFARQLAGALSNMGADVWIDVEDIPAGMKWSSAIQQGLDSGELLILIISPDSMVSQNVEDEWQYYLDHAKPVVPVLLQPAKIHFQLNRLQYIDFHTQAFDIAINQLYAELRRKGLTLNAPAQPQPPAGHTLPNFDRLTPEEIDRALEELQKRRGQFDPAAAVPYPPPRPASSNRLILAGAGVIGAAALLVIGLLVFQNFMGGMQPTNTPPAVTQDQVATHTAQAAPSATAPLPTHTAELPTPTTDAPGFSVSNPVRRNADWQPIIHRIGDMEMALVPVGRFTMGTAAGALDALYAECSQYIANCRSSGLFDDETPTVEVSFDKPFWIGRFEVTNAQFRGSGDELPRTHVTWLEAQNFCVGLGMRLPTEREWEYASRGPDSLAYPWGNEFTRPILNYCDGSCSLNVSWKDTTRDDTYPELAPVGGFPDGVSWVGAQDMAGNVWEWTSTIYRPRPGDGYEDPNDRDSRRTLKGSSWNWIALEGRGAARSPHAANNPSSPWYGFRCAKDFDPADLP